MICLPIRPAPQLALIEDEQKLNGMLSVQGKSVKRVAEIDGLNYSSGDKLSLGLYRVTQ